MPNLAIGTKFKIGTNAVANINTIGGVSVSADTHDITTLDSIDGYREFMQGLRDGGEIPLTGFFTPSDLGQKALIDAFNSGEVLQYTIIFPAALGAQWSFYAIVTGFSTNADKEDVIGFEATIKVTGKPELALTASANLTALSLAGTGGSLSPSFAGGTYYYSYGGMSSTSFTVTATLAGAEILMYVDGVFVQKLASGAASGSIAISSVGSKLVTLIVKETAKAAKVYEIVVIKTT